MSDRDLEYAHPTDDLSRSITATLTSGSQATGYEPVRLTNDDPSYPFKSTGGTFRLLWDFGSAMPIEYVLLVHHNFYPGLGGVIFAMGSTNSTTDFSREFVIRQYHEDSFPVNEHLDLRDVTPTYRYASLEVTSPNHDGAGEIACSLGGFPMLTEVRALDGDLLLDTEDDESHPLIEHRTDVGVSTIYSHGTRLRWLRGDKIAASGDAAAIRSWNRASLGRGLPFVLIPHVMTDDIDTASPIEEQEESWLVRWEKETLPRNYFGPDLISRYRLEFEEVSRGLKPTPSAV